MMPLISSPVQAALDAIRGIWDETPTIGLILGTGLGHLTSELTDAVEISYRQIPHFPRSTAMAHRGSLLCGKLAGSFCVTMAGRCHLYEGYAPHEIMLPTEVMHHLGVRLLMVTNAAGGINPAYAVGDVMAIDDHINLMFRPPIALRNAMHADEAKVATEGIPRANLLPRPIYDPALIDASLTIARQHGFHCQRGVYVGVSGPNYETRSEYRMFRQIGGDVVGMSTIPEVTMAANLGMRVLALSTVTNIARPDAPQTVTSEEVVHVAAQAEPKVRQIVVNIARQAKV